MHVCDESIESNPTVRTVTENGNVLYTINGFYHREDGPAVIIKHSNTRFWYCRGLLHRIDGPASCINGGNVLKWYQMGKLHREDGPAVVKKDGLHLWYSNGLLHNNSGPSVILQNGEVGWAYLDKCMIFSEWCSVAGISDKTITHLRIMYPNDITDQSRMDIYRRGSSNDVT